VIPLDEFYSGRGEAPNGISQNEILVEIHVPRLPPCSSTAYIKYRVRDGIEFPTLGAASMVTLDRERKHCLGARFAIVGHSSKPLFIEATQFVAGLEEPVLTEEVIDRILKEVKPVHHMGVSASFKRVIARACVNRAFLDAWKSVKESDGDPV
jgi:CO/xanthine dehydrogenase FAD-binding subunit